MQNRRIINLAWPSFRKIFVRKKLDNPPKNNGMFQRIKIVLVKWKVTRDGHGTGLPVSRILVPVPRVPGIFVPWPMGRLWDSQNSWDCLGLESQGKSRDFGIFYKNMIYSSHFAKIDLQNWNFHELQRSHVTIFADSFSTNRLNRYAEIGHLEFRRSNVKWVHLRSNLRFRLKNGIPVPLPIPALPSSA